MNKKACPPKKALNFLLEFMDQEERESFKEYVSFVYKEVLSTKGLKAARRWFWSQFIRAFSIINSVGLSIGMSCFILIMLYVQHELSYDKFHKNSDRTYRVTIKNLTTSYLGKDTWCGTCSAMAHALMDQFPEVEHATRFTRSYPPCIVEQRRKKFLCQGTFYR